jgi:hypothetical protein
MSLEKDWLSEFLVFKVGGWVFSSNAGGIQLKQKLEKGSFPIRQGPIMTNEVNEKISLF